MKTQPTTTRVIFRMLKGECIAIFPQIPGDTNARVTCLSYMHLGQHGAACVNLTGSYTAPATQDQYAPLLRELRSIGYTDLVIAYRATRKDYLSRLQATQTIK